MKQVMLHILPILLAVPSMAAGGALADLQAQWYGTAGAAFTDTVLIDKSAPVGNDNVPVAKIKYRVSPPWLRLEIYDYAVSRTQPTHLFLGRMDDLLRIGPSGTVPLADMEEGWDSPYLQMGLLPLFDPDEIEVREGLMEGRLGPLSKRVWMDSEGRATEFRVQGPDLEIQGTVIHIGERIRKLQVTSGSVRLLVRRGKLRTGVRFANTLFRAPGHPETPKAAEAPADVAEGPLEIVERSRVSLEEVQSFLAEGGLLPLGRR